MYLSLVSCISFGSLTVRRVFAGTATVFPGGRAIQGTGLRKERLSPCAAAVGITLQRTTRHDTEYWDRLLPCCCLVRGSWVWVRGQMLKCCSALYASHARGSVHGRAHFLIVSSLLPDQRMQECGTKTTLSKSEDAVHGRGAQP